MAVKLFYKSYPKSGSQDYLIILHGLFGMLDNWHNMARRLSEHMNVITVDQRNHGQSPHTDEMSFELMAEDLKMLLAELAISKASVLGHSMGGKTAMKFADLYPELLDKLIVVDIAPKKYKPGHDAYFKAFHSIDFSKCETRKDADEALAKTEPILAIRQFLLKNLERKDSGYQLKMNIDSIEAFYPDMIDELSFQWIIPNETLFVYGLNSKYITEEDKLKIHDTFPNVTFQGVKGAGHWVHAEQPDAFYAAVTEFFGV